VSDSSDLLVFGLVLVSRLVLPLFIFKYPLPGIIGCLVLDAADQTIFEEFTNLDLAAYQSYDKALDIFYLAMAYLAMLRNWRNGGAFAIGMALLYYRLAGVALFELTDAQHRFVLLLFPNTFEYFFIVYEVVRTRWDPRRVSTRVWLWTAAVLWVVVKLPQEYWIHVAQLDTTDLVAEKPWVGVVMGGVLLALALFCWYAVRPRLPAADHRLTFGADPVPTSMRHRAQRNAALVRRGRIFDLAMLEKIVLVSFVTMIFASIIPSMTASPLEIIEGSATLVVINSAIGMYRARRGLGFDDLAISFFALAATNVALVLVTDLLRPRARIDVDNTLFFVLLLTLIVTLYDRYRPVHDVLRNLPGSPDVLEVAGEPPLIAGGSPATPALGPSAPDVDAAPERE
jgi:hypothetical protein